MCFIAAITPRAQYLFKGFQPFVQASIQAVMFQAIDVRFYCRVLIPEFLKGLTRFLCLSLNNIMLYDKTLLIVCHQYVMSQSVLLFALPLYSHYACGSDTEYAFSSTGTCSPFITLLSKSPMYLFNIP